MFKKMYIVVIEAQNAVPFANYLSDKRLWFHIGDEYVDYMDPQRRWFRKVKVLARKGQIDELCMTKHVIGLHFVD